MFITKKVFDPALLGKAVYIKGLDIDGSEWDRLFLVQSVEGDEVILVNSSGINIGLHMENFETGDLLTMKILELPKHQEQPQPPKKQITRKREVGSRNPRTDEQIRQDNEMIEDLLRENIDPMKLQDIITKMQKAGRTHWTSNNGCGFVKMAIKNGRNIRKIGLGLYAYGFGGDK
jgi:hypothetical protein